MTVANVIPSITFSGTSGSGTMGPFSLVKNGTPIIFFNNSDIVVLRYASVDDLVPELLVEGTDYDLTGGPASGEVLLTAPQTGLLTDERLLVMRRQVFNQALDLINGGNFSAANLERRLDIFETKLQELNRDAKRTIRYAMFDADEIPGTLPLAASLGKVPYVSGTTENPVLELLDTEALGDLTALTDEDKANLSIVAADLNGADTIGTVAAIYEDVEDVAANIADVAIVANWIGDGAQGIGNANVTATGSSVPRTLADHFSFPPGAPEPAFPYYLKREYRGNITLGPGDNLREVIERHSGRGDPGDDFGDGQGTRGIITLADGAYDLGSGVLIPSSDGTLVIQAENMGQASITGRWRIRGADLVFAGVDLIAPASGIMFLPITRSRIQFRDTHIDGSGSSASTFSDTSHTRVNFSAISRHCDITMSPTMGPGWDFGENSYLKMLGNTSANRVRFFARYVDDAAFNNTQMLVFDGSRMLAAGAEMYALDPSGAPLGTRRGRAITLRRRSDAVYQDVGNVIDGFNRGVQIQQGAYFDASSGSIGLTFNNLGRAVNNENGAYCIHPDVAFTGNGTDIFEAPQPSFRFGGQLGNAPYEIYLSSGADQVAAGETRFIGIGAASASNSAVSMPVARAGVVTSMHVRASGAVGAGENVAFTLWRNGNATDVVATLSGPSDQTVASAAGLARALVAGGNISIRAVASAGATSRTYRVTLQVSPGLNV